MANPVFNEKTIESVHSGQATQAGWAAPQAGAHTATRPVTDGPVTGWQKSMTVNGTSTASAVLLVLLLVSATFGWNAAEGRDQTVNADVRRLTNVGTLRAYIEAYLRAHPMIHEGMTLLVRQLQPSETGLPIEIYCFTSTTEWNAYEGIQGDIFAHIFAIIPEFGLRAFQSPAGADLAGLRQGNG